MSKQNNPKKSIEQSVKTVKPTKATFFELIENKYIAWYIAALYFIIMLIISFSQHKIGDYGIETDFFWSYVPQADNFLSGNIEIDKYRGPLYPIVLAILKIISGNYFTAGMLIAILSASFVLFFVFKLLKNLFSPLVALITTLLVAVNTTFNLYTYSAGTDMFFNFIITAALYFLLSNKNFKWINLGLAALFAAAAYLTRYNGIFIFVSTIVFLILFNIYKQNIGKRLIHTAFFVGVFIVLILPWGIYTHQEKGKAFWNQNYQNVAYEFLAKDKMGWDEFWYKGNRENYTSLTQVILQEPGAFFNKYISNGFEHLWRDLGSLIGWHLAFFSMLGLLLLFVKPPEKFHWAYYLANLLFFGVLMLVFYSERFSLFLIPFYLVFAVNAIFTENKYLKKSIASKPSVIVILALVFIIWTLSKSIAYNSENINSGDNNLIKLKEEFNKVEPKAERGEKIMARKAHVAYYLDLKMTWVDMVPDYYKQVTLLWKADVDYVSYGIWEIGRGLNFIQELDKYPQDLKMLVYVTARNKAIGPKADDNKTYNIDVQKQEQPAMLLKVIIDEDRKTIIKTGDWLNKEYKKEKDSLIIMSVAPYLAAYSDNKFEQIPDLPLAMLVQLAKSKGVDMIYLGGLESQYAPQAFQSVLANLPPEGLEILLDLSGEPSPAILFKVK